MKKYISPEYEMEKVETSDIICQSRSAVTIEDVEAVDKEGNVYTKTVATVSFSSLFGK